MDAQVLIQWLKREVSPALGCTEPVAIAFAAAVAAQHLGEPVVGITGTVSENLYKNAMGVTIPGTGSSGVALAAAIGSIAGDPNAGLEVFRNVMLQHVAQANLMVSDGQITIEQKATHEFLHVDLTLKGENRQCRVIVNGGHTNVTYLAVDDHVRIDRPARSTGRADDALPAFTLRDAFEFAGSVDFDDIAFILEAAKMNSALSAEGRRVRYGLNVGGTLRDAISQGLMQNDLLNRIVIDATSASDARMGGATLPAMTNFGSGNQGITATMPVVTVAEHLQADDETLARALALSHLVAISIHARYTRLSALCAVTTAAMGAAAGMSWLFSKDFGVLECAVSNMVGDISGIICDGASNTCAMKVSTSVNSAFRSVLLAGQNIRASSADGIVCEDVEDTIDNLCSLVTQPMKHTDQAIIRIMSDKSLRVS
ncbi:MAG: serine dehydratase subunit alpha family protein [Paraburkholderia sp.]|uniref:L-cysteine desulfidase family protein n=1 Tax=Paraburkholderia sp. TaxID=1926495 RepID=UPI001201E617|nr:L-serine ammonia-lyase, iron-sulfur-dependent, subunit alpha [Paraburkholderia sp.]TAM02586.1 MAG: serine dehydratase subunit alpha family protein [Paraburkholderia sp.]TAM28690.1 MAG: serine dehydratase subunit alpha family protein [Paraburkholderia sp.]